MHALFLQQLRASHEQQLQGAVVRRIVCVAQGFLLELQGQGETWELALLGAPGTSWALLGGEHAREHLHAELGDAVPALVQAAPAALAWQVEQGTALDALRAWILRPAAGAPGWFRLQGARLLGLRTQASDRRLWLDFETSDAVGHLERLELVAELFDHSANFFLRDAAGAVLAAWRERRQAPEPASPPAAEADAATAATTAALPDEQVFAAWDGTTHRACPVRHETGLSLAGAAYMELATAAAVELQRGAHRERARHEKRLQARLRRLGADATRAAQAASWRRQGELLTVNMQRLKRGQESLIVDDYYTPGQKIAIALDPQLSPQENVARLFKQARRAERGRTKIEARLQEAQAELDALAPPPDSPEALGAVAWIEGLRSTPASWTEALPPTLRRTTPRALWSPAGPPWQAPIREASPATARAARGPGRCFMLPGNWEVRVGRDNAENDELTHRFAHADDIWLHASGVPGSHVVLRMQGRKDNPPRETLEIAAAIAARYSQAKHAGTVPVLWTRKRYVRKPRRAAPGLAQCTHEKTLFVTPGLPASSQEDESS